MRTECDRCKECYHANITRQCSEHIPSGLVLSVGGLTLVINVSLCTGGIRVVCGNGALSKIIGLTAGLLGSLVSSFSLFL